MKITLSLINNKRSIFQFQDVRATTSSFSKTFSQNYALQKNYYYLEKALEIPFGDSIVEDNFTIYNIDLLSPDFMSALKLGMHNRWNSKLQEAFDPAINPSFYEELLTQEDLEKIQATLYAIYRRYGEHGLTEARGLNLAHAICDSTHFIEIEDPDNKYDLELSSSKDKKVLYLDDDMFDPIERALEALGCDALISCQNENIKSALFAMPYLLYRNSNMVSPHEIRMMIKEIEARMEEEPISLELDRTSYLQALEICKEIFVRNNEDILPKRKDLRQYQKKENI